VRARSVFGAASPQREARTSGTVPETVPLVLAWRCGLAAFHFFRTASVVGAVDGEAVVLEVQELERVGVAGRVGRRPGERAANPVVGGVAAQGVPQEVDRTVAEDEVGPAAVKAGPGVARA